MLWTGGKDSSLALYEAVRAGFEVRCLVTYAPPQPKFLAHSLRLIELQARALRMPHLLCNLRPPFDDAYEAALARLRDESDVGTVITGDIARVGGMPNWIGERCRAVGLRAHMPLWESDREELLRRFLDAGFLAWISCVDIRRLGTSWVGRPLNEAAITELRRVAGERDLDLCGEQGEYHTVVLQSPMYRGEIKIGSHAVRTDGQLAWLDVQEASLTDAAA